MRIVRAAWASLMWVAVTAAILLGAAALTPGGDWRWPRGWLFLLVFGGLVAAGTIAMAVLRPASFDVRQQGLVAEKSRRQPLIDAAGTVAFAAFLAGWLAFVPVDVFYLHLLPPTPPPLVWLGAAMTLGGATIAQLAVAQNRFAAPTVQEQAGQQVVDTGLYAWVRHPLYAGNLLCFTGIPLWLGSTAAAAGGAVILALFTVARIAVEETHLRAQLPGYAAYAARVRGRVIPFVL